MKNKEINLDIKRDLLKEEENSIYSEIKLTLKTLYGADIIDSLNKDLLKCVIPTIPNSTLNEKFNNDVLYHLLNIYNYNPNGNDEVINFCFKDFLTIFQIIDYSFFTNPLVIISFYIFNIIYSYNFDFYICIFPTDEKFPPNYLFYTILTHNLVKYFKYLKLDFQLNIKQFQTKDLIPRYKCRYANSEKNLNCCELENEIFLKPFYADSINYLSKLKIKKYYFNSRDLSDLNLFSNYLETFGQNFYADNFELNFIPINIKIDNFVNIIFFDFLKDSINFIKNIGSTGKMKKSNFKISSDFLTIIFSPDSHLNINICYGGSISSHSFDSHIFEKESFQLKIRELFDYSKSINGYFPKYQIFNSEIISPMKVKIQRLLEFGLIANILKESECYLFALQRSSFIFKNFQKNIFITKLSQIQIFKEFSSLRIIDDLLNLNFKLFIVNNEDSSLFDNFYQISNSFINFVFFNQTGIHFYIVENIEENIDKIKQYILKEKLLASNYNVAIKINEIGIYPIIIEYFNYFKNLYIFDKNLLIYKFENKIKIYLTNSITEPGNLNFFQEAKYLNILSKICTRDEIKVYFFTNNFIYSLSITKNLIYMKVYFNKVTFTELIQKVNNWEELDLFIISFIIYFNQCLILKQISNNSNESSYKENYFCKIFFEIFCTNLNNLFNQNLTLFLNKISIHNPNLLFFSNYYPVTLNTFNSNNEDFLALLNILKIKSNDIIFKQIDVISLKNTKTYLLSYMSNENFDVYYMENSWETQSIVKNINLFEEYVSKIKNSAKSLIESTTNVTLNKDIYVLILIFKLKLRKLKKNTIIENISKYLNFRTNKNYFKIKEIVKFDFPNDVLHNASESNYTNNNSRFSSISYKEMENNGKSENNKCIIY